MYTLKLLPEFSAWLGQVRDPLVKAAVLGRLKRLERGLPGDCDAVGDGIVELRIHIGAGWRIYYIQRGPTIIVLLAGGTKRTQSADIKRAKARAAFLG